MLLCSEVEASDDIPKRDECCDKSNFSNSVGKCPRALLEILPLPYSARISAESRTFRQTGEFASRFPPNRVARVVAAGRGLGFFAERRLGIGPSRVGTRDAPSRRHRRGARAPEARARLGRAATPRRANDVFLFRFHKQFPPLCPSAVRTASSVGTGRRRPALDINKACHHSHDERSAEPALLAARHQAGGARRAGRGVGRPTGMQHGVSAGVCRTHNPSSQHCPVPPRSCSARYQSGWVCVWPRAVELKSC